MAENETRRRGGEGDENDRLCQERDSALPHKSLFVVAFF